MKLDGTYWFDLFPNIKILSDNRVKVKFPEKAAQMAVGMLEWSITEGDDWLRQMIYRELIEKFQKSNSVKLSLNEILLLEEILNSLPEDIRIQFQSILSSNN
jgi:hypothetical protein